MNKLHPGARWIFRLGALLPILIISVVLVGNLASLLFGSIFTEDGLRVGFILTSLFFIIIIFVIFIEIYARMAYNRWLYEFTPTNLKMERGIIWKRYSNIPYERVQNVDIHRGVIARILGFSEVRIHTAGYSGGGRYGPEGRIPAVNINNAEEIRDFLMKKISKNAKGGL